MRSARFLRAAVEDLAEIRRFIIRESRSIAVAQGFTAVLRARCDHLASLPGTLGRARDDLAPGLRSVAHRDYVILFRYTDVGVQVIRILHGQRDLPAVLSLPGPEQRR